VFNHALFALGIFLAIGAWLPDTFSPDSWVGHVVAPRYRTAMAGYRILTRRLVLSKQDPGFGELLELAIIHAPQGTGSRIDALRFGGFGIEPSSNSIYIELLGRDGGGAYAGPIYNPPVAIRERFFDKNIRLAKAFLFFGGIAISVVTYMVIKAAERRREELQVFQ
jgi:hypothetical protein